MKDLVTSLNIACAEQNEKNGARYATHAETVMAALVPDRTTNATQPRKKSGRLHNRHLAIL